MTNELLFFSKKNTENLNIADKLSKNTRLLSDWRSLLKLQDLILVMNIGQLRYESNFHDGIIES